MRSACYFVDMFNCVWKNRQLIKILARRDVESRYRGSLLGLAWAFFTPIILLCTYTFIFSIVFQAKWTNNVSSKSEFALILFSGLIIYNIFSECVSRSPALIVMNPNYVKKVVFPLEILPVVSLIASIFHAGVSFIAWFIFYILLVGLPKISILYLPVVIMPLVLYTIGFSWALASLGVFLRDVAHVISLFLTVLMFISPVFYPMSAIPEQYRAIASLNPLAGILEQTRNVLFGQAPLDWSWFIISFIIALFVSVCGFIFFQTTRKGFSDVI